MSGEIGEGPTGGTQIVVTVGIATPVRALLWIFAIVSTGISASLIGAGIADAVSGRALSSRPFLLIPIVVATGLVGVIRGGAQFVPTSAERLVECVCLIVDGVRVDSTIDNGR